MIRTISLILRKDILVELRTREVIATMVLFSVLVVVIFAFAFNMDETRARLVAPGIVWVTVLFAGTLGLGRIFDREREHGCMTALLLAPAGPEAVYLAKALGVFLFTVLSEVVAIPLILIFVGVQLPLSGLLTFCAGVFLGTLGMVLVGTLFGAMLATARLRDLLLPIVVYPVVVPVIIAGVEVVEVALAGGAPSDAIAWLEFMGGYDLVFMALCPWVFGRVMVD